ncbi:NAD(P)H-binding protein [Agriterribacter sp.]|uniref:NAD(P)H-binding protein n=1 Tax=Agriterribacter sp. TaxID=2821509 RepID=UPI002C30C61A|nr:NAD(P)H-binding protein [Agriterribacter sp.]HRO44929.1 NAD(P)H-binding protein [Agriterribacter sp.]HRQ15667.1 NAD(P)H-binding protein [Agriterribacter sp.]
MQTILGAGGSIGVELAKILPAFTDDIRLVSRTPQKINAGDELFAADITDATAVDKAVSGSEVVYLTVGFPYRLKIWEERWPVTMRNVIDACKKYNARLVFFDNVYMYDRDHLHHMTEETPVRPTSKKGAIRQQIADMLMDEVKQGKLTALIARSADFTNGKSSVLHQLVTDNLVKGKRANWLAHANKVHNFTFVADAANGTAILGNTSDAFNQVWHLPTDQSKLTGRQWIELIAKALNAKPRYSTLSTTMLGLLGIFMPVLKEIKEMTYQYDRDYFFDSSKFNRRFSYTPVTPDEAVKLLLQELQH